MHDLFIISNIHLMNSLPSIWKFYTIEFYCCLQLKETKQSQTGIDIGLLYIMFAGHACDQERIIFRTLVD